MSKEPLAWKVAYAAAVVIVGAFGAFGAWIFWEMHGTTLREVGRYFAAGAGVMIGAVGAGLLGYEARKR